MPRPNGRASYRRSRRVSRLQRPAYKCGQGGDGRRAGQAAASPAKTVPVCRQAVPAVAAALSPGTAGYAPSAAASRTARLGPFRRAASPASATATADFFATEGRAFKAAAPAAPSPTPPPPSATAWSASSEAGRRAAAAGRAARERGPSGGVARYLTAIRHTACRAGLGRGAATAKRPAICAGRASTSGGAGLAAAITDEAACRAAKRRPTPA